MKRNLKVLICSIIISLFIVGQALSVSADTYYGILKYGSKGSAVVQLQQALKTRGFLTAAADGVYGKSTENAVIKYQISKQLRIDGIAGRETQASLFGATTIASRGTSSATSPYATNLYWLSRIIHAEAEAEPYTGKVAVGNVILNRVKSGLFPDTVKAVIFDDYEGIPQFSPVADGTVYNTPGTDSVNAAKDALNGVNYVGTSAYFFNPDKSEGTWIVEHKTYVKRIGNHVFYK